MLVAQAGTPRYVKIDIEGAEVPFLESMVGRPDLPEFVSAECYDFYVIALMHRMGSSGSSSSIRPPGSASEKAGRGQEIFGANFFHSSGPFGLDVFTDENWMHFAGVEKAWALAKQSFNRTWSDCHAWRPRSDLITKS